MLLYICISYVIIILLKVRFLFLLLCLHSTHPVYIVRFILSYVMNGYESDTEFAQFIYRILENQRSKYI